MQPLRMRFPTAAMVLGACAALAALVDHREAAAPYIDRPPAGQLYTTGQPRAWASWRLDFPTGRERYLVAVCNLARRPSGTTATLTASAAGNDHDPWGLVLCPPLRWATTASTARSLGRHLRASEASPTASPARSTPASCVAPVARTFWLDVGPRDRPAPGEYRQITARCAAERPGVRVYVDDAAESDPTTAVWIAERLARVVRPRLASQLGEVADIDGDGHLTVVVTAELRRLNGGQLHLGGMVVARDFELAASEPHANRADVIYLADDQRPGPHLETLLAHELTHAIRAGNLAWAARGRWWMPVASPLREEAWLGEGLAHVAENLAGDHLSNLDERVAAYLERPGGASLLGYPGGAGERDPGRRGAAYLFCRWCVAHRGVDLARRMLSSSRVGLANLQSACGGSLDELYPWWAIETWQAAMEPQRSGGSLAEETLGSRSTSGPGFRALNQPWGSARRRGIRTTHWRIDRPVQPVEAVPAAHSYLLLTAPSAGSWRISLHGTRGDRWQASIVRLSDRDGTPQDSGAVEMARRDRPLAKTPGRQPLTR